MKGIGYTKGGYMLKMKRSRWMSVLLISMTCIGLLSGCNAGENSKKAESKIVTTAAVAKVEPAKEIVFWSTDKKAFGELTEEFYKQTGIKVVGTYMGGYDDMVNKVMAGIRSNNLPDVAQLGQRHGISQMYDSKALLPTANYINKDIVNDILPAFWKRFTYKGEKVVLPFQNSMPAIYYNKTLFEQAGVTPPTTFEELQDVAEKVKKATGKAGFNMREDTPWYINALVYNSGKEFMGEKSTFNQPEIKEIFGSFKKMAETGVMPKAQHKTAQEDFTNGEVGMLMASVASYKKITELVGNKFELGVAMFPKVKTMDIPMGGNGLGIFNTTPEKVKAAAMFVEFMLEKERIANNTLKTGYIPVRQSAIETAAYKKYLEDPNRKIIHEQLVYLGGRSVHPADSAAWNEIQKILEKVEVDSNVNIDEALKEADKKIQKYIDEYKR